MVIETNRQNEHTISIDDSYYVERSREEIDQTMEQATEIIRNHMLNIIISK